MATAEAWFTCRIAFVETFRAVAMAAGTEVADRFSAEWPAFSVVEVDQRLATVAAERAVEHGLRSLDALHLAAALLLPRDRVRLVTWDARLHTAGRAEGLAVVPATLA